MIPPLTPADIMDLRASITYRGSSDSTNPLSVPFIVYGAPDGVFYLHAYGGCQCASSDPRVLGAMLAGERAEPGYIRRVLSPLTDCDTASLVPDDRVARERHRAALAATARQAEAERAEAVRRRAHAIDVSKLDLEDL